MPCSSARARELLRKGKAVVLRMFPFTIMLKFRDGGVVQKIELKIDPGSKTTGIVLVGDFKNGKKVIFAVNLKHRGEKIKNALKSRCSIRRGRRNRSTRYREPRFLNRTRPKGWLPPSLESRVSNVSTFTKKLVKFAPVSCIALELVKFDTQKLNNQLIQGVEYQQGTLFGFELREYLLEKWHYSCAYCDAKETKLEIEHVIPIKSGGSNRVSNLVMACRPCNKKKDNLPLEKFLNDPVKLQKIKAQLKAPMKDAAAVNSTRYAICEALEKIGLKVSTWSGGLTKFNRANQGYKKEHWVDAACIGETGNCVKIPIKLKPLVVTANGHGSRQMCRVDKFGFPRTKSKSKRVVHGFQTGDIVTAIVTKGKKIGTYFGRVAIRVSGSFNIKTASAIVQSIRYKYFRLIQKSDGYSYEF